MSARPVIFSHDRRGVHLLSAARRVAAGSLFVCAPNWASRPSLCLPPKKAHRAHTRLATAVPSRAPAGGSPWRSNQVGAVQLSGCCAALQAALGSCCQLQPKLLDAHSFDLALRWLNYVP
eukprot:92928-Amphidinium_carterae.1